MRKITIGRNNSCNIVIPDTSDLVSRRQAVLAVSFFGRMIIYDTSNNGTYVNGQKLEHGKGVRVTRRDRVNFARMADLNWNDVKDPYRKMKIWLAATVAAAIVIAAVVVAVLMLRPTSPASPSAAGTDTTAIEKGATTTTVTPTPVHETKNTQPKKKSSTKSRKNKTKQQTDTHDNAMKKDVDDNSPIFY